jgi:hypothetical protein
MEDGKYILVRNGLISEVYRKVIEPFEGIYKISPVFLLFLIFG